MLVAICKKVSKCYTVFRSSLRVKFRRLSSAQTRVASFFRVSLSVFLKSFKLSFEDVFERRSSTQLTGRDVMVATEAFYFRLRTIHSIRYGFQLHFHSIP